MDFTLYKPTQLERWIEQLYRKLGILHPSQLTIDELAGKLNIWIYYLDMSSRVVENNGMFSMNIDRRLSPQEQWQDFLHELCHVLRHAGNQLVMPTDFKDRQEMEAGVFQLYAGMPFFMIGNMPLPATEDETIEYWAHEFRVTYPFAKLRLEQMQRRMFQEARARQMNPRPLLVAHEYTPEAPRLSGRLQRQVAERRERYHASSMGGEKLE